MLGPRRPACVRDKSVNSGRHELGIRFRYDERTADMEPFARYPEQYRPFVHPSRRLGALYTVKVRGWCSARCWPACPAPTALTQTALVLLVLGPIRLALFGMAVALYWTATRVLLLGWPSPDVPVTGCRMRFFRGLGRILSRSVLFCMGYLHVEQRGRPHVRLAPQGPHERR